MTPGWDLPEEGGGEVGRFGAPPSRVVWQPLHGSRDCGTAGWHPGQADSRRPFKGLGAAHQLRAWAKQPLVGALLR